MELMTKFWDRAQRQPGTEPPGAGGKVGASQAEVHRSDVVSRTKTWGSPRPGPQTDLTRRKGLCECEEDNSAETGRCSQIPRGEWGRWGGARRHPPKRERRARKQDVGRQGQRLESSGASAEVHGPLQSRERQ